MKSVVYNHFPRVIAGQGRYYLFNPILKKRYKNRPEERVRLSWTDYILHQTDWKKSRIGFETPVKVPQEKNTLRADLILYSDKMEPSVLIECKSAKIKLTESAAEQAAKYNREKDARFVILTNGVEDYWFEVKNNSAVSVQNIFNEEVSITEMERDGNYWTKRGFCSTRISPGLKEWLLPALNTFWGDESNGRKQFLDFEKSVLEVPMNHFFKIFDVDDERKMAVTFAGYGTSENYLLAILNTQGVNRGVLIINLDKYEAQENKSVRLVRYDGREAIIPERFLPFEFDSFYPEQIKNLEQHLIKFFD